MKQPDTIESLTERIRAIEAKIDAAPVIGIREANAWARAQRLDRKRLRMIDERNDATGKDGGK